MTSRVVFMGTPEASVQVLQGLLNAGHHVLAAYTQPDKPAGRGRHLEASPVKQFAEKHGIPVHQPVTLRKAEAVQPLRDLKPDILVVAAYGKILPRQALEVASRGGLNIHPSLLPRHRGPTPVRTTILEGDTVTGVTLILMDEGMDSGPIVAQQEEAVRLDDTTGTLTGRLFAIGTRMLLPIIDPWVAGDIALRMQQHAEATFTKMIQREDAALDFTKSAVMLERQIRASQPAPSAYTAWDGKNLKLLEAAVYPNTSSGAPGRVIALPADAPSPIGIVTGDGMLAVHRLQLEGKRATTAEEFMRGYRNFVGSKLMPQDCTPTVAPS
ncbi:MAG: methionyl-tRNA formyltransferase [Dehalococcoidia bacterium]|nr:methionyl-tRNA formyltransferase [Dehalococcoidia bacterium]